MSEIPSTVSAALSSILSPKFDIGAPLSTTFMALRTAIDQLKKRQDNCQKEVEQIRHMSRTNWLVINMPLPFGQTKCQALQQLLCQLEYSKPLFDAKRDLLAADILHVN
ncbi:unnamed protein product [Cylicocyclus nassatus]|uniref:Uncharacterized protein n=1 Tax=Cylicocyclus nassatus TaxID=53992 RepID=A0AA36DKP6_CYLNA|nr:unnamed protein product [Cylicocyclus nassatus]